ncbi:GPI ethanolamine phosphate transferase 1 isoform X2 [Salvia miltiorrhiza]|uniref:GPI ethanolamine phosphate transferase 1 isoform X2 n=1 Tax=Salvia miltiorrhiza TaxID=226208 RepID=UPI0025AD9738|nr:GPI ethanolamine phosphate transferase 1 isoform X2 [Salvia miltiorrhiza]
MSLSLLVSMKIPVLLLKHSTWNSYPHEYEDFATDASFLDEWSLDQFEGLLNRSNEDVKLKQLLQQDNLVVFLHLLGCDSNGHAHRPYSTIYLNNVRVVDQIAERVYNLVQNYFKDNLTAFVFTADHGMSDKGSHGDGHPSNTDTPLVAWGAGVRPPVRTFENHHHENTARFVDDHVHDMPTPVDWGLDDIERQDVNQADIAPLMSTLVGLPCPVNSVGNLPLGFVNLSKVDEVEAVLSNTKQILSQFLRKSQLKQSNLLRFKPFKPLDNYALDLDQIEQLISISDYEAAKMLSENLRSLALEGLHYFQTYDWFRLMTVISLGYLGWMIYLMVHVLQSYTSLPRKFFQKDQSVYLQTNTKKIYFSGCLLMGAVCVILLVEHSPPLYHAYFAMTIFLWVQICCEYRFLIALWRYMLGSKISYFVKLLVSLIVSVFVLEILVKSFMDRKIYTWSFLIIGVIASVYLLYSMPWGSGLPVFVWLACWSLSIFTLMPAEIPDNTKLVVASGLLIVIIGVASRYLDMYSRESKYWLSLTHEVQKSKSNILFIFQVLLVAFSALMVPLSTNRRTEKQELLVLHQVINWSIAGVSIVLPLFSPTGLLSRLTSIYLGFAPAFLLLSIGYEAVFYGALALALMAWILFENAYLYISQTSKSSSSIVAMEDDLVSESNDRCLLLSDMRIPLAFMVFFNIAFFGTGNFASIASFEISSVYRFITVFSPFLMAALLIFKLLIPFVLVVCTFTAITGMIKVPLLGCYFLVIICSDVMTVHFFFLVRNTGSWMEIGNSISHFGIMSAQVVFVLLLFAVTSVYTKDIQIRSSKRLSQKQM